mgnify:FL=1
MAWKYPKRPIVGSYVIDIEPINKNLLNVVEESSGFLNEHNLTGLVVSRFDLPEDISMSLKYTYHDDVSPINDQGTNWRTFPAAPFFQTKSKAGLSITGTFRGGPVWICGSFTLHCHNKPRAHFPKNDDVIGYFADTENGRTKGFGYNVAIELDGAILPESLIGTGDQNTERYTDSACDVIYTDASTPLKIDWKSAGGGINGAMNAVVVDAVIDVTPGRHTIRIAILDISGSSGLDPNTTAISTSELFALEMAR